MAGSSRGRLPAGKRQYETEKSGEICIKLPIPVTDRSQITNLLPDTRILKERTTWRILPSIFLILDDFDHLPHFFSVSMKVEGRRYKFAISARALPKPSLR
jgi:hypothetical protein